MQGCAGSHGLCWGKVTAFACKKDYPVYVDETAKMWDVISVLIGQKGVQILIAPGTMSQRSVRRPVT